MGGVKKILSKCSKEAKAGSSGVGGGKKKVREAAEASRANVMQSNVFILVKYSDNTMDVINVNDTEELKNHNVDDIQVKCKVTVKKRDGDGSLWDGCVERVAVDRVSLVDLMNLELKLSGLDEMPTTRSGRSVFPKQRFDDDTSSNEGSDSSKQNEIEKAELEEKEKKKREKKNVEKIKTDALKRAVELQAKVKANNSVLQESASLPLLKKNNENLEKEKLKIIKHDSEEERASTKATAGNVPILKRKRTKPDNEDYSARHVQQIRQQLLHSEKLRSHERAHFSDCCNKVIKLMQQHQAKFAEDDDDDDSFQHDDQRYEWMKPETKRKETNIVPKLATKCVVKQNPSDDESDVEDLDEDLHQDWSDYEQSEEQGSQLVYRQYDNNVVELMPGSKVYVNKTKLKDCKGGSRTVTSLTTSLVRVMFTARTLHSCSAKGENDREGLDRRALAVILAFAKKYAKKKGWPKKTDSNIVKCLNTALGRDRKGN